MLILLVLVVSLVLTLLLEEGFAFFTGLRGWQACKAVAVANVLTNPMVVLLHYLALLYMPRGYVLPVTLLLEMAAVTVEWQYYRYCMKKLRHPFWFSLAANAFSYLIGCFINTIV